ncbi:MAG: polyprenyl synthetase family protein [Oscillospiraceae bacterium]|nr:polyprenyl synthetase family protein [Oscillospiraceae bacterium]
MLDDFRTVYEKDLALIEKAIREYFKESADDEDYKVTAQAMRYSAENGGKRIRPVLVLEFCKACGGDISIALPFACAIEMIHTYSLIHDDLPCMDNDDMRRGKPSCHVAFGEEYALLAGDALLTLAFSVLVSGKADASTAVKAVREVSKRSGIEGMVAGQTMDLLNEDKKIDIEVLQKIHLLKTGALIECCAVLGCIAANANDDQIKAARRYGKNLGLAFQIIDDILDVEGNSENMGKQVGSDASNNKSTYVTLLGIGSARMLADKYTNEAIDSVEIFDVNGNFLKDLAENMKNRDR